MKIEARTGDLPRSAGGRYAIVSARFYGELAAQLEDGARRGLAACGVTEVDTFAVPGCYELPLASQKLAQSGHYEGVVALGVVVRGETPHFDYVAGEASRGLMDAQLRTGIPIGFGVLTTDTLAQAEERADPERGDKGFDAAVAAVAVAALSLAF